jgi:hypothetical protein
MKVLERIVNNHLTQLEMKTLPREYKIILYDYALKFLKNVKRDVWAGECMRRLYAVASELDGSAHSTYREVRRVIK